MILDQTVLKKCEGLVSCRTNEHIKAYRLSEKLEVPRALVVSEILKKKNFVTAETAAAVVAVTDDSIN